MNDKPEIENSGQTYPRDLTMDIIFLGTNGWYDSPTGSTICTLINSQSYHILLDAGNGLYKADLGEPRKAIEHYEKQLMITRAIGDRRGEGNALFNTSLALDGLGKQAEAEKPAADALAIYEQIESPVAEQVRRKLEAWQG